MSYLDAKGIFSITMPSDSVAQGNSSPFPKRQYKKSTKSRSPEFNSSNDQNKGLDFWVARALNGEDISKCDPELVPDLIQELNDQWEFDIENGYYFESEFAYKGFKAAQQLQKDINNKRLQNSIKADLKQRKEKTQASLQDLDEMVQVQSANMEKQFSYEIEQLMDKHDKEIEEFNRKWSTVKQRLYNKASSQLNLLYQQENKLTYARRYEESYLVAKEASKLEKIESREKAIKMEFDYRNALRTLIQKQREEMKVLLSNHNDARKLHQGAKEIESDLIGIKIKKIDRETEKANDISTIQRIQKRRNRGLNSTVNFSQNSFSRKNNKAVIVSEFNEVPLPPLNAEQKIQFALKRRTAALSPDQKSNYHYDFNLSPTSSPFSKTLPRSGRIVLPNKGTPKAKSQTNSPRNKFNQKQRGNIV